MRRPGRRPLARLALALIGLVAVLRCLGDGSPVGHFASAADKARFIAAYDRAMAALPHPQQVRDLRTGYGIVRVYAGASHAISGEHPAEIAADVAAHLARSGQ